MNQNIPKIKVTLKIFNGFEKMIKVTVVEVGLSLDSVKNGKAST